MTKTANPYDKILKFIYIICGAFGFIAYFSYLIKVIVWPEGARGVIIAVCGSLITFVPVVFRRFFEKHLPHRLFKVLENIFAWGMFIYTVTFAILVAYIFNTANMQLSADDIPENSAFIVYGAGLRDDRPGNVLKKRLDRTAEYMEAAPDSICVVSGAQGPTENYTEASVMKKYLVECGISEDRILEEDRARNTKQNIKYSVELLNESGEGDRHIVSVSNSFHIPRIKLLCSRTGVDGDFVLAKNPNRNWLFPELVREYMAYIKLAITGVE